MQAFAYLKAVAPEDGAPTITLDENASPILQPLTGDLLVSYVIDQSDYFTFVNETMLRSGGLTHEALHCSAVANLKGRAAGQVTLRTTGPINALFFDGHFEASLMLLDDLWDDALARYYATCPVVVAPSRDVLAFCDAGSSEGIAELRRVVARVWPQGDHLLSRSLFIRRGRSWSPFTQ